MKVILGTCNSTIDLVKFTFKKKKKVLTNLTLLIATLSVTWQIMPIILITTNIINSSLISYIWALEKYQKKTKLSISTKFVNVHLI